MSLLVFSRVLLIPPLERISESSTYTAEYLSSFRFVFDATSNDGSFNVECTLRNDATNDIINMRHVASFCNCDAFKCSDYNIRAVPPVD